MLFTLKGFPSITMYRSRRQTQQNPVTSRRTVDFFPLLRVTMGHHTMDAYICGHSVLSFPQLLLLIAFFSIDDRQGCLDNCRGTLWE